MKTNNNVCMVLKGLILPFYNRKIYFLVQTPKNCHFSEQLDNFNQANKRKTNVFLKFKQSKHRF
jgi:hypothetical protein